MVAGQTHNKKSGNRRTLVLAAIALLTVTFALTGGPAMGLFEKLTLFSKTSGKVLFNGKPAAGATLVQSVSSKRLGEVPSNTTKTDTDGNFSLPAITKGAGLSRLNPAQVTIRQALKISYQGKDYDAWINYRGDFENNSENKGKPLNLVCELTAEPEQVDVSFGICKFQN